MKKNDNFYQLVIIVFIVIVIIFTVLLCFLEYYNQIRVTYFSLDNFEKSDSQETIKIVEIQELENYYKIRGQINEEIITYKIDIGIENEKGKIGMHKTQYDITNNQFYTYIPKKYAIGAKTIYIVDMCNNQNVLIKTDNIIGGVANE